MKLNPMTRQWSWLSTTSTFYGLAIKKKLTFRKASCKTFIDIKYYLNIKH